MLPSPVDSKKSSKEKKAAAIAKVQRFHSACLIQARLRGALVRAKIKLNKAKVAKLDNTPVVSAPKASEPMISQWPTVLVENFFDTWPILHDEILSLQWIQRFKKLYIRTITWNLCAQAPPDIVDSSRVLFPGPRFHFYIIGSEECERSIAQSAVNPSKRNWEDYLGKALGSEYVPIRAHTLQAIHLMCFAHVSIAKYVHGVSSAAVATGMGNTLGNKGGVGIFFCIGNTSFVMVNAHAAAHQNAVAQRNSDCNRICAEMPWLLSLKNASRVQSLTRGARRQFENVLANLSDDAVLNQLDNKLGLTDSEPIGLNALLNDASSQQSGGIAGASGKKDEGNKDIPSINMKSPIEKSSEFPPSSKDCDREDSGAKQSDDAAAAAQPKANSSRANNSAKQTPEADNQPETITGEIPANSIRRLDEQHHFKRLADSAQLHNCADRVIFMGDLNYRIHGKRSLITSLLEKNMHEVMIQHDQLKNSLKHGYVFTHFTEPPLNFKPTYKFDHNSDQYDTSRKKRAPAWTDRILYVDRGIRCLAYGSDFSLKTSDHRPVYATFVCDVDINLHIPTSDSPRSDRVPRVNDNLESSRTVHHVGPIPQYSSQSQVCSIM